MSLSICGVGIVSARLWTGSSCLKPSRSCRELTDGVGRDEHVARALAALAFDGNAPSLRQNDISCALCRKQT